MINKLDSHGFCLLHYFAAINYCDCITLLMENGADMNVQSRDSKLRTPFIIAAHFDHEASVKLILASQGKRNINN